MRDGLPENFERGLAMIGSVISYIAEAESPDLAALGVAVALDDPMVAGMTIEEIARGKGVSREIISKHARIFCEIVDLEPSPKMKPKPKRR